MLGAILREARLQAGKALKETGKLIGVSGSTLSSYEHGRRAISLPELEILAFYFDIPLSAFWSASPEELRRDADFDPHTMIGLRQRIIGAQLRAHRQSREMSIKELATELDLPSSRISAYERGTRPIPIPELEAIVAALGSELSDYFDDEGPIAEWNMVREAYERLSQLPPDLVKFLNRPDNQRYLQLAKDLSELRREKLQAVAQALLEISP